MTGAKRVFGGVLFTAPPIVQTADVTAAGTTQATATPLAAPLANVSGADDTKGVRLPAIRRPGQVMAVYNTHATAGLKVYPATGASINGGTADAAITIEGKTLALFLAVSASNWAAIYTANV